MRTSRKTNGPRHARYCSVAATIQETANAPYCDPDRDRWRGHVRHFPEREWTSKPIDDRSGEAAQDAAVKVVASLPAPENVAKTVDRFWVCEDINSPRTNGTAEEQPSRELIDDIGVDILGPGSPHRDCECGEASQQNQHSIAVNRNVQARYDEQDRPHPCFLLAPILPYPRPRGAQHDKDV
jgi:hypothetical protein